MATSLREKEAKEDETGCFILATNDISGKLTMNELLSHYKSQQAVERGFRFLKSPDFFNSIAFLEKTGAYRGTTYGHDLLIGDLRSP